MLRLRILGTLDFRNSDGSELGHVLTQPRRLALLVYLAVARRFTAERCPPAMKPCVSK